jgi:hypothetical protein
VHGVNLKADIPVTAPMEKPDFSSINVITRFMHYWSWTKTARQLLSANFVLAIEILMRQ